MAKLTWDDAGKRFYETGVKHGVLFVENGEGGWETGVAWNGLISVTESPSGADAQDLYADDMKYLSIRGTEEFGGTIEAYTYPDEFMQCDGSVSLTTGMTIGQQERKGFALCYTTTLGNDTEKNNHGYKIHIVYGCTASPSDKDYQTINDSPEAITFSWEFETVPVNVTGAKPTSLVTLDSTKLTEAQLTAVENKLFGGTSTQSTLVTPDELKTLITGAGTSA